MTAALFGVLFVVPAVTPDKALADDVYTQNAEKNFTYENRYNWSHEPDDYSAPTAVVPVEISIPNDNDHKKFEKKSFSEGNFKDRLLAEIPYGEDIEEAWQFVDGDTDIMAVKGLRVDRRNKGVAYTTSHVPFVGTMDGMEFKFAAGEDMKISLESDHLPMFKDTNGFKVKASTSNKDSKIFVNYTMKLD